MLISVVIRTLNEERYLPSLLQAIASQDCGQWLVETVLVDSGSTDATVQIAREHGCQITTIRREEFSFGRSLNVGCEAAGGDILVFISGHCVPTDVQWLQRLCQPIADGQAQYVYGRQLGGAESSFSECRIFEKYYPTISKVPQKGFFCNNANSALARHSWLTHRFDEELTGLEDMELAKRICDAGGQVAYIAEASVHHYHHERWAQVKRRFEREALALQKIMPQIQVTRWDLVRYVMSSVFHDWRAAHRDGRFGRLYAEIVRYRVAQYLGSYTGNHEHRKLSKTQKELYFYPLNLHDESHHEATQFEGRRVVADEGKQ